MNRMKNFIFSVVAILLSACATTYQPLAFSGGYAEIPVDASTYRISFEGNGYSKRATVESYLLFRAAELTAAKGFDWFLLAEREGESQTDDRYGQMKIASTAILRMYKGEKPTNQGYNATEVIKVMGPSIKR